MPAAEEEGPHPQGAATAVRRCLTGTQPFSGQAPDLGVHSPHQFPVCRLASSSQQERPFQDGRFCPTNERFPLAGPAGGTAQAGSVPTGKAMRAQSQLSRQVVLLPGTWQRRGALESSPQRPTLVMRSAHIVESLCFVADPDQNSEAAHQLHHGTRACCRASDSWVWPLPWNSVLFCCGGKEAGFQLYQDLALPG